MNYLSQVFWAAGSMFGALLALATLPHLDWHWYLALSAAPTGLLLLIFPVSCTCRNCFQVLALSEASLMLQLCGTGNPAHALKYIPLSPHLLQCIPESARFYVVRNKQKKAEKVIKLIAWFNCKVVPQVSNCMCVYTYVGYKV